MRPPVTALGVVVALLLSLGSRPAAQDQPLVQVIDRGGLCPGGVVCTAELDVFPDGSAMHQATDGTVSSVHIDPDWIGRLEALIAATDFAALRGVPFSGTCPTAYDAPERMYLFATSSGVESLATCEIDIDHTSPLIGLVDDIVAGAVSDGSTNPASVPAAPPNVGCLEGRATIGPLTPVEHVGVPPATPAPAVCTARGLVILAADSGAQVNRFSFEPDCTYRIALVPGTYRVELDRRGIDRTPDLPRVVTITPGQTTRVDVDIDTGLR
ncbi:MAG TPA: hypothetical protein VFA49_03700 [Chloroflexota bacterium]|nr:hypothetical protein [Chloroflexota bacterium]